MCCRGTLHGWATLQPGERRMAEQSGLDVFEAEDGPAFRLPCPRLDGTACEIYGHRPATCSGYRCRLLDDYLAGRVELDAAQALVGRALELGAEIQRVAGPVPFPELRQRWRDGVVNESDNDRDSGQRLLLHMTALYAFLDRHFVLRREGSLIQSGDTLEKTAGEA